ncbi:LPP20 lipoprotein [Pseudidiomarina planktonica]|uniref:LPP20 lipoprotein n=1 Tax=Pseudidiomarina planktonica TaxID=1323738 RepID=A0A1Y6ECI2_9GAMM|nr:LPP20 family lipoprotein [Pseudidiomarina planktonica]RUO66465.1 hypothetical protein CWI77_08625 [Pseudidiomarina planktonica]SMQ57883.1 LPP20 lipoprotein [Pseudidiomarina planktonica]
MTKRFLFFILCAALSCIACAQTAPDWYSQPGDPSSNSAPQLTSVGTGATLESARQDALGSLVSMLYAEVSRKTATGYYETNQASQTYVAGTTIVNTDSLPLQNVEVLKSEQRQQRYYVQIQVPASSLATALEEASVKALTTPPSAKNQLIEALMLMQALQEFTTIEHYLPVLRSLSNELAERVSALRSSQQNELARVAQNIDFSWQAPPSLNEFGGDIAARLNAHGFSTSSVSNNSSSTPSGSKPEQWQLVISGQFRGGKQANVEVDRQQLKQLRLNLRWYLNNDFTQPALSSQIILVGYGSSQAAAEEDIQQQLQQLPIISFI